MTQELAFIPQHLIRRGNKVLENVVSILVGVTGVSLLAQIAIPLPLTPVPITGQTFGVALASLMWGRKRGVAVVLTYLGLGALGLPVFAMGQSGFSFGPTTGYLIGMVFASYWIGLLSDLGWTRTFLRSYFATFSGSAIIFFCGVIVLSFFIPSKNLITAGVLPFLPGDFIKTLLASFIATRAQNSLGEKTSEPS